MTRLLAAFSFVILALHVGCLRPLSAQDLDVAWGGFTASALIGLTKVDFDLPSGAHDGRERTYGVRLGPRVNFAGVALAATLSMTATPLGGIDEDDRFAFGKVAPEWEVASRYAVGPLRPHLRYSYGSHTAEVHDRERVVNYRGPGHALGAGFIVDRRWMARAPAFRAQGGLDLTVTYLTGTFNTVEYRREEAPVTIDHRAWSLAVGWTGPFDVLFR